MAELGLRVITNITKEYPDMIKIVTFKTPRVFTVSQNSKRSKVLVDEYEYSPSVSSLNRTKSLIRDLVLCNDFELFATFTFDPKQVDSFNLSACWGKMNRWIHHQSDRSREKGIKLSYLFIPEQHKSGRWHFHALLKGYTGALKDTKLRSMSLSPIYNITSFRSGFTTCCKVSSKEALSNYVTKYITKDLVKSFNQRRFFCSRDLVRPIREINSDKFNSVLPIFRRKVAETGYAEEFVIDKFSAL